MTDLIVERAAIPGLLAVLCIYYGIKVYVFHDISAVRPAGRPPVKDPDAYCRIAGLMIFAFAAASLVMMALMTWVNIQSALAWIIACTALLGIGWKKLEDRMS